jgi:MFS transporter, NRE family, putaive nickel resistance protein
MMKIPFFFAGLQNPIFRRLYIAQSVSLLGDALSWLGLALLAFELAGNAAPLVLSGALTLRVMAFVLFSPLAGVLADRLDRKGMLVATQLARFLLVSMLPLVTAVWQIYILVLGLNIFNAFFTPTYQATIPLVTSEAERTQSIALASATTQILGVFGPGIAGALALVIGAREVFWLDGLSFLIAAIMIGSLPVSLRATQASNKSWGQIGPDLKIGTELLWRDAPLRYGLGLQLVGSISGAQILVNTVRYVQGHLGQTAVQYGWVMMAFGLGATLGAWTIGNWPQYRSKVSTMLGGGLAIAVALLPANAAGLSFLMVLWFLAGFGQSLINLSMQTLIADRTPGHLQGRVYGAHFAWSHFWWAGAYPLAGWLGLTWPQQNFFYGGAIGLALLLVVQWVLRPDRFPHVHGEIWHSHHHDDDLEHQHDPATPLAAHRSEHQQAHYHETISHIHRYNDISHQHSAIPSSECSSGHS